MNIEQTDERRARAAMHAALGDVTRLHVVDLLAVGDRSTSELGSRLGVASNLLAHHLRTLETAGIVTRRRSEGDARRSYVSLNAHDEWLLRATSNGGRPVRAARLVFVCTANTARSHLAAAAWRSVSEVPATSAGTQPGERIHPGAVATAERHGLRLPDVAPVVLAPTDGAHDLVVTVCDRAHEDLAGRDWAHWSVPDPVPSGTSRAFDAAYEEVAARAARLAGRVTRSAR